MKHHSNTPQTDEEEISRGGDGYYWDYVQSDFARKLERERDEARREAEVWRDNWRNQRVMSIIISDKFPWEKTK